MISFDLHEYYDNPPNIPAFSVCKKTRKADSVTEAVTGAAMAVTRAFQGNVESTLPHRTTASPSKTVDVRLKNLEQLKIIQQLRDDDILTSAEYMEQKEIILSSLRRLT